MQHALGFDYKFGHEVTRIKLISPYEIFVTVSVLLHIRRTS